MNQTHEVHMLSSRISVGFIESRRDICDEEVLIWFWGLSRFSGF